MRRRAGKLVVQYMRAHRDLCAQFVPGDFTEYCDRMGTDGVHIEGDVEIRAAAEVLNVNIYTFAQSDHHDRHFTRNGQERIYATLRRRNRIRPPGM